MLAGCPAILSPRIRLRSEASLQLQARYFKLQEKLGSMSTQRLDLPCSFNRKETPATSQPPRPSALSVEKKPIEAKTTSRPIHKIVPSPSRISSAQAAFREEKVEINGAFWAEEKKKSLKRFSEQSTTDESCGNRTKRKRSCCGDDDSNSSGVERLSAVQLGSSFFWFPFAVEDPRSVPSEVPFPAEEIFSCIPFKRNSPWVESVLTEITEKGDCNHVFDASQGPERAELSSSSTSSESNSYGPKSNEQRSPAFELGNESQIRYSSCGIRIGGNEETLQGNREGLEIVNLLIACVEAVETRNLAETNHFLSRLGELASPEGTPIHRVAAYFAEALAIRTAKLWPYIFHVSPPRDLGLVHDDIATSFRLLNHVSPIPKFLHFSSNEMILKAFERNDKVHIIDFDIKQGLQWPGLLQCLASRQNPPARVRITGIGDSKEELQDTGDRLAGFASALNLAFEFHPAVERLEDLRLWMLHVKDQECVAVNCILQLHKLLYDEHGGALRDFLGVIRSAGPAIVVMAEQEADHNHPRWGRRFLNALQFYSAIFDSIDSGLPFDNPARVKVEEMFGREIRNIAACEGEDRVERHERFEAWKGLLEGGGFKCVDVGEMEMEMLQGRMLLKMFSCENFSVAKRGGEDGGGLTLSWLDQPLYTVSAWQPSDSAGCSSNS